MEEEGCIKPSPSEISDAGGLVKVAILVARLSYRVGPRSTI